MAAHHASIATMRKVLNTALTSQTPKSPDHQTKNYSSPTGREGNLMIASNRKLTGKSRIAKYDTSRRRRRIRLEAALNLSHSLSQTLAVFDDRESQEAFAFFTEAAAGADGDAALLQQLH